MKLFQKKESMVIEDLKKKVIENINQGLYIESLRPLKSNSTFTVAPDGTGLQVQQLGNFIGRKNVSRRCFSDEQWNAW